MQNFFYTKIQCVRITDKRSIHREPDTCAICQTKFNEIYQFVLVINVKRRNSMQPSKRLTHNHPIVHVSNISQRGLRLQLQKKNKTKFQFIAFFE